MYVLRTSVRTVNQGAMNNTRIQDEARRYYYTTPHAHSDWVVCVWPDTRAATHTSPPISPTHIILRTYKSKLGPIRTGKESQSRKTLLAKKELSGYRNRFNAQKTPRKLSVKCDGALERDTLFVP